jgi:hypothetical protein
VGPSGPSQKNVPRSDFPQKTSNAALAKTNTQHKKPQKISASLAKTPQMLASLAVSHKKNVLAALIPPRLLRRASTFSVLLGF